MQSKKQILKEIEKRLLNRHKSTYSSNLDLGVVRALLDVLEIKKYKSLEQIQDMIKQL